MRSTGWNGELKIEERSVNWNFHQSTMQVIGRSPKSVHLDMEDLDTHITGNTSLMFDQISRRPISMKIDYLPLIDEYFSILPMNMIVDDDMLYSYDNREMIFDHI
ncbi:hypothetical protein SO802_031370 [Lithocarpus litseifolius]|uniref:Uncharacterized protein n=1 Tax=Lithocarpus litseifolius TaxID=425828 RepID=A0AAW2BNM4_9ROSI